MAKPSRYTEEEIQTNVESGAWKTTISQLWDQNATRYPHKEAVEDPFAKLTWAEAKQWTDRVSLNLLELGIERDDAVVIQLPNWNELPLLRVACEKAGVLCAPVQVNLRQKEMEYTLRYLNAAVVVIPWKFRGFDYLQMIENIRPNLPRLRHVLMVSDKVPEEVLSVRKLATEPLGQKYNIQHLQEQRYKPTEVSIINHTTGTTGFPKFAEYPAGANAAWGEGQVPNLKLTINDVIAAVAPAGRGPCLPVYYDAPWVAAKVVMIPWGGGEKGAQEALKMIEARKVTVVCVVPTQLAMMMEQFKLGNYDLGSVRVWYSAGALIPPSLVEEIERKIGGIIISNYGGVDFGGLINLSVEDSREIRKVSVGRPCFGSEIKLVDNSGQEVGAGETGEILGRGSTCSSGYYKDPEKTKETWKDGWFAMGDLGRLDERGNLMIVGRKKDMVIRGGQNIYPAEIENLLLTHPKVQDIAIVGMPDLVMGERVCAYVVPKPGQIFTFEEMVSFLREKGIASFKLPERLEVMDRLPLVADQKVDKKALRQDITSKLILEKEDAR